MVTYRQPFKGDYPITQRWGEIIPGVTYKGRPHSGIDFACPSDTPILASADGVVRRAAFDADGYGKYVTIEHSGGISTLYAHLNSRNVIEGQQVRQGDVIGESGSTGNSTGPHLHFEARRRWNDWQSHFDPMTLPLTSFADFAGEAIGDFEVTSQNSAETPHLPAGIYQVACQYAFIRTWDALMRDRTLPRGERVYIFDDIKYNENGLPFHFIGAGRCIAEYDIDGTKILEPV